MCVAPPKNRPLRLKQIRRQVQREITVRSAPKESPTAIETITDGVVPGDMLGVAPPKNRPLRLKLADKRRLMDSIWVAPPKNRPLRLKLALSLPDHHAGLVTAPKECPT